MNQLLPGIWTWSIFSKEKGIPFHGWYVQSQGENIVIDPPTPGEKILQKMEKLGRPSAILLTNKHHTRASEVIRRQFDCSVWIHEKDKKLMEIPIDETFVDGDLLPGGLKVTTIPDGKTPGESAFFLVGERRVLFVGDAIIGKPPGSVSMLPPEKFKDPVKAKEGLQVLLSLDFDGLLLGDGESIISGGKTALKVFLSKKTGIKEKKPSVDSRRV